MKLRAPTAPVIAGVLATFLAACSSMIETTQEVRPVVLVTPTAPARLSASFPVNGKILFVKSKDLWIWQNNSAKQLTSGSVYEGPDWSPDGKRIVAVKRASNYSDLVILSDGGKLEKQLTRFGPTTGPQDSTWTRSPSWSPNGSKLAFSADPGTYRMALWMVNSGGGGLARANYRSLGDGDADAPTWSPDGKSLAFAAYWEPASQIYVANQSTGAVQKLTNHQEGAYDPAWSPDGAKIAYVARIGGKNDIWVVGADGSNAASITSRGSARAPQWSPDGQHISFLASQNQSFDLFVAKVSLGAGQASVSSDAKQLTNGQSIDPNSGVSWAK